MDKNTTQTSSADFAALVRRAICQIPIVEPKESTVRFLKNLARNYRPERKLPDGLRDFVLS